jgi:hypothetical protein
MLLQAVHYLNTYMHPLFTQARVSLTSLNYGVKKTGLQCILPSGLG